MVHIFLCYQNSFILVDEKFFFSILTVILLVFSDCLQKKTRYAT